MYIQGHTSWCRVERGVTKNSLVTQQHYDMSFITEYYSDIKHWAFRNYL